MLYILKLFPSLWQRSVINEAGLRAQPWWNIEDTDVESEIRKIEKEVDKIRLEGILYLHVRTYVYMYMYIRVLVLLYIICIDCSCIYVVCRYT